jgi:hypothetical protein
MDIILITNGSRPALLKQSIDGIQQRHDGWFVVVNNGP